VHARSSTQVRPGLGHGQTGAAVYLSRERSPTTSDPGHGVLTRRRLGHPILEHHRPDAAPSGGQAVVPTTRRGRRTARHRHRPPADADGALTGSSSSVLGSGRPGAGSHVGPGCRPAARSRTPPAAVGVHAARAGGGDVSGSARGRSSTAATRGRRRRATPSRPGRAASPAPGRPRGRRRARRR
jgi:hypothetical protein